MPGTRATIRQMLNFFNANVRLAFAKHQNREQFLAGFKPDLHEKLGTLYDDYHKRVLNAQTLRDKWLADGNEAAERGNQKRADYCYAKSQTWTDRYNRLVGDA